MYKYVVQGNQVLNGVVNIQGAKNEALQVISATLLSDQDILIKNIPDIIDIKTHIEILKILEVSVIQKNDNDYIFNAKNLNTKNILSSQTIHLMGQTRGSLLLLAPLLVRFNRTYVFNPGGDKIGRRKIDTHLQVFQQFGANTSHLKQEKTILVEGKLKAGYIFLEEASLTATANAIMIAASIKGVSTIYNAACEPYIQKLCLMLTNMGATIKGMGSNLLTIQGNENLQDTVHEVSSDMIEIGSFIGLSMITKSELTLQPVDEKELGIISNIFTKLGAHLIFKGKQLQIKKKESFDIQNQTDGSMLNIMDAPWPGFTPDLISIAIIAAIQGKGEVLIHQKMFESRLFFVDRLIEMGAKIILCDPHRACIIGLNHQTKLKNVDLSSPDIRSGMALLFAAISADGTSEIYNINQIERGYQNVVERLKNIGVKIEKQIIQ